MNLLKRLFGDSSQAQSSVAGGQVLNERFEELSEEACAHVASAVQIIESRVAVGEGYSRIELPNAELANAVQELEKAHSLHPLNLNLHYAYASALWLVDVDLAATEMKRLAESRPDFLLAKFAVDGWERWESPFTFPTLGKEGSSIHPAISSALPKFDLLAIRDGLVPRGALFLRDSGGEFRDLGALRSAKIDVTLIISPVVTDPQVIAIYARVWDSPASPYGAEALSCPFVFRGDRRRSVFEFLCTQEDIDFVVMGDSDLILLKKRLKMPRAMYNATRRLLNLLETLPGQDIPQAKMVVATMEHRRKLTYRNATF